MISANHMFKKVDQCVVRWRQHDDFVFGFQPGASCEIDALNGRIQKDHIIVRDRFVGRRDESS